MKNSEISAKRDLYESPTDPKRHDETIVLDLLEAGIGIGAADPPGGTPDDSQTHWAASPYRLVSVADAARFLGISRSKVYEMVNKKQLPKVKMGTRTGIPLKCLEEFVQDRLPQPSVPVGASLATDTGRTA